MSPETWPTLFFITSCHCKSLGALLKEMNSQACLELRLNPLFPATRYLKTSQQREELVSLYQQNLVFGELAGEVCWDPPSHTRGTSDAGCERAECLPTSCLRHGSVHWCRLLKVRARKNKSFLKVRNGACLLNCTSQTWVLWPGLTLNPPCKQLELALSGYFCPVWTLPTSTKDNGKKLSIEIQNS